MSRGQIRAEKARARPQEKSCNTLSREHPRCLFPFPPKQVDSVAEGIWLEHFPPLLRLTGRTPSQLSSGSLINLNRNAGFLSISHSGTFTRAPA